MRVQIDPFTLTSGDVAKVLGVTDQRVRQLDKNLRPRRRPNGRRYYRPSIVEAFAKRRFAKKRGVR